MVVFDLDEGLANELEELALLLIDPLLRLIQPFELPAPLHRRKHLLIHSHLHRLLWWRWERFLHRGLFVAFLEMVEGERAYLLLVFEGRYFHDFSEEFLLVLRVLFLLENALDYRLVQVVLICQLPRLQWLRNESLIRQHHQVFLREIRGVVKYGCAFGRRLER